MPREADTVGGGDTRNTVSAALHTNAGEDSFKKSEIGVGRKDDLKRFDQSFKQKLDCSQVEDHFGEGDVMNWYEDDEIVRQWDVIRKRRRRLQRGRCKERAYKLKVRTGHPSF